jgi:predicted membrane channel-forming protein YqfA (hemolysin III family)
MIKKILPKIVDFVEGVFLLIVGLYLLVLYYIVQSKPHNWDIYIALGIALCSVAMGLRRVILTFKKDTKN